ncbi:CsgG/HfaB family protein [Fulvimarina sp. 2208YS6-2-32]|uniref:CsgG/HfaB family protein n=1 Tax=Fulvimarina uroteuthidis TaxID=3098149 RepID=A0ABU5I0L8_9HYPH|nr:CsgG/HfaB family protein [Fulvimarina sp. 2208YS6-2-32]MDY8108308.1 CsgG/HfaB family protein [Fulvimarina sp. 2208YS6-2-32]
MKLHVRAGKTRLPFLVLGASLLALSGCVTAGSRIDALPVVAPVNGPNDALRRLPPPRERTVVAVYDIEDLTGQFKERDNVQSLSRAVTQGGAAILIKSLQDAGERRWFTVLERKELENLLRERQILTEMRRIYNGETDIDARVLPPLLHAGIIIEGGIIGYDTNIVTGGIGARFLAIGADTRYVQDVVTVTLRAVSTKTGEVLTSVTSRKAVASYALQGGAFRFVRLDELLEAETGTTYNEPKQIAVQSAIEKAVEALIIEGAELDLWQFADKAAGQAYIQAYRNEKFGDRYTLAAQNPPSPRTTDAARIAATVPGRPRPVQVTQRRIKQPAPQPAQASGATRTGGAVRQVPGVGFVPSEAAPAVRQQSQPPQLPPAPQPDEPVLGQGGDASPDVRVAQSASL